MTVPLFNLLNNKMEEETSLNSEEMVSSYSFGWVLGSLTGSKSDFGMGRRTILRALDNIVAGLALKRT